MTKRAFRGSILHFRGDPATLGPAALEFFDDGLLLVENGRVTGLGDAAALSSAVTRDTQLTDYSGKLILPGFVDTHVHFAQTDMIASYGEQLLTWLNRYAFPTEERFGDPGHATGVAQFFLRELLRNGTTSAAIFGTVHPASIDALFEAALTLDMRVIAGKVLMDRNCPETLRDSPERGYAESKALIERWHGRGRLHYAVTPRFAPTSSAQQMTLAGQLFQEYPDLYLQSHLAENCDEVAWVANLYPDARSYLDVYRQFGQVAPRSIFGHCIWLDDEDRRVMSASGAAISFCPTSNLFIGSGLFDMKAAADAGIRVGIGTDVGGGTSFSMLRTLAAAYQVLQLKGQSLAPEQAFYLATLGGARSLYLDDRIGNFEPGKDADFTVLDLACTPLIARRIAQTDTLAERLFVLMTLGDDRAIAATHIAGEGLYVRAE